VRLSGASPRRPRPAGCIPRPVVTLYHAPGCHLCDRARGVLATAREELGFDLVEVDISGDTELEARYREWLPVVEIAGERAFVYHVDPIGLRRKLARVTGSS
jgi:glutaredoxin